MNSGNMNLYLASAQEALRDFLGTLLGQDAPLILDPPVETTFPDAQAQTLAYTVVVGSSEPGKADFAVMLDDGWAPVLSQAMLGETLEAGAEGTDDLLRELAAQGYGAVRNQLAANGIKRPEISFEIAPVGSGLPPGLLPNDLLESSFGLKTPARSLGGFALLPRPAPAAATAGPGYASAMASMPQMTVAAPGMSPSAPMPPVQVAPAAFTDLGSESLGGDGGTGNFNLLAEVELELTVELGRRRLPLADMLRLTTGSVIELEKLVGEPLEVYANGRLIAVGEAVVIDEQFGIRVTNLAANRQRAKAFL